MERQGIGGESGIAVIHGLLQQGLHGIEFVFRGVTGNAGVKPHDLNPQH